MHPVSAAQYFRTRRHASLYSRARSRHMPHVLVKGGSFNEREEVEAIRDLLGGDRAAR